MTSADINRDTLTRFLIRAIGHASAVAIDAEFGLRVCDVESIDLGDLVGPDIGFICVDLGDRHSVIINFTHHSPCRPALSPSEGVRP